MYTIRQFRKGDEDVMYRLLHNSRRLIQILACYEDSSRLDLGAVLEMTSNPNFEPSGSFFICRDGDEVGFATASKDSLHFFHVHPDHFDGAAEMLLDHLLAWWRQKGAHGVRQARMESIDRSMSTISDVFRLVEDTKYIDLFLSKDFTRSPECGNMMLDLEDFTLSEGQRLIEGELRADGIMVRGARRDEISEFIRGPMPFIDPVVTPYLNSVECDALQLGWDRNRILGYCAFFPWTSHFPMPEVGHIFVDEQYRRRGIGQILLCHLLAWGKKHGAQKARLSCINDAIPRFHVYSAVGFHITDKWYQSMERIC